MAIKKPDWFELKVTLGNVLTLIPLGLAVVVAYADIRSDIALARQIQARDTARIEKLEARDDIFAAQFTTYQTATIQSLTRLETQMGILLQERRLSVPPPGGR
jgi:hypothetical protein